MESSMGGSASRLLFASLKVLVGAVSVAAAEGGKLVPIDERGAWPLELLSNVGNCFVMIYQVSHPGWKMTGNGQTTN